MVKKPGIGGAYWVYEEVWGEFITYPVKITAENVNGTYRGVWVDSLSTEGEAVDEEYTRLKRNDMYDTKEEALEAMRRQRDMEGAQMYEYQA